MENYSYLQPASLTSFKTTLLLNFTLEKKKKRRERIRPWLAEDWASPVWSSASWTANQAPPFTPVRVEISLVGRSDPSSRQSSETWNFPTFLDLTSRWPLKQRPQLWNWNADASRLHAASFSPASSADGDLWPQTRDQRRSCKGKACCPPSFTPRACLRAGGWAARCLAGASWRLSACLLGKYNMNVITAAAPAMLTVCPGWQPPSCCLSTFSIPSWLPAGSVMISPVFFCWSLIAAEVSAFHHFLLLWLCWPSSVLLIISSIGIIPTCVQRYEQAVHIMKGVEAAAGLCFMLKLFIIDEGLRSVFLYGHGEYVNILSMCF